MRRLGAALLACVTGTSILAGLAGPAAAGNAAPKIVRAVLVDRNADQIADAVKLVYSEKIRHARDADGRYPFKVKGFTIKAVKAAKGTTKLVIVLKPHASSDLGKTPLITYSRTRKQPVRDMKGKQAVKQSFKKVVALGPVSTDTEKVVTVNVDGPGSVVSDPPGIACPPTCSSLFDVATVVTLQALPSETVERAAFESWAGACSGTSPSCVFSVVQDATVDAHFIQTPEEDDGGDGGGGLPLPLPTLPGGLGF